MQHCKQGIGQALQCPEVVEITHDGHDAMPPQLRRILRLAGQPEQTDAPAEQRRDAQRDIAATDQENA